MEVKLDKRYPLDVDVDRAWAVLSDVRATAACMPGAQITTQVDDTHYKGLVKAKVGPATMSFDGDIEVLGLDPAARSLQMLGKGADKAGSSASMNLAATVVPGETPDKAVLTGQATIVVAGKLAQFGSRLLVPVSDAMLAQFANNFRAAAAAKAPVAAAPPAEAAKERPVGGSAAGPAPALAAAPAPAPAPSELNALALMWVVLKGMLGRLFGRGKR
jgi:carbon monoxide dehydrogenase subunit G